MKKRTPRQDGRSISKCPRWCTRHHIGWHRGEVGVTEFGDMVVIRLMHSTKTPLIGIDRAEGASLTDLTFTQAATIADLLDANGCMDQDLAPLLREAVDLIKPALHPNPVAAFLLRVFGQRRHV